MWMKTQEMKRQEKKGQEMDEEPGASERERKRDGNGRKRQQNSLPSICKARPMEPSVFCANSSTSPLFCVIHSEE